MKIYKGNGHYIARAKGYYIHQWRLLMTPKEKAKDLVEKYLKEAGWRWGSWTDDYCKKFALIGVEEQKERIEHLLMVYKREEANTCSTAVMLLQDEIEYLQQVKEEINKL